MPPSPRSARTSARTRITYARATPRKPLSLPDGNPAKRSANLWLLIIQRVIYVNKIQEINLKIIELEHKVAFQELTMDTLNDEIYRQQKKIDVYDIE